MRTLLIVTALLLAALATLPSASAQNPVCVPPGTLNGACVGNVDGDTCAWYWGGANHSSLCTDRRGSLEFCSNHVGGTTWHCTDLGDLIAFQPVCAPPGTGNYACVGVIDGNVCAWTSGAARHSVCAGVDGVVVCSNQLYRPLLGDGTHCSTELLTLGA